MDCFQRSTKFRILERQDDIVFLILNRNITIFIYNMLSSITIKTIATTKQVA